MASSDSCMELKLKLTSHPYLRLICGVLGMIFILPLYSYGTEALVTSTVQQHYGLGDRLQYIEDETGELTFSEITSSRLKASWQNSQVETPNFGIAADSAYWFAIPLFNDDLYIANWLLEIGNPTIDSIELYILPQSGLIEEEYSHRLHGGNQYPFSQRQRQDPHFLFTISLEPQQTTWLYLRVKNSNAMKLPLTLWQEEAYTSQRQTELMIQGAYFGMMAIMAIYNLFVYFSLRDKSYLYYVLFVVTFSAWMFIEKGLAFQYIWPNGVWQNSQLYPVLASISIGMTALFTNEYLSLRNNHPTYYRILYCLSLIWVVITLCAFVLPVSFVMTLIPLVALPGGALLLSAGLLMWKAGLVAARYYTIAWTAVILGAMTYTLLILGIAPSNIFTENALQVGSILEVFLLSLGLANRINSARKEKEAALLESAELKTTIQKTKLNFQHKINKELEGRVQERTQTLEVTLGKLAEVNKQLQILSTTDGLTGVMNRRFFDKNYPIEWRRARREQLPLSIIMVDIDYFKRVNDNYGHSAGDECLKIVASALKYLVKRPADAVSRFGGEEFVMILPNTDLPGASYLAEHIRGHIEALSIEIPGHSLQLTISLGVATTTPSVEIESEALFCLADDALYTAKDNGRNQVVSRQMP